MIPPALAQGLRDDRALPGPHHEAQGHQDDEKGHHQVDGGKGDLSRVVGHKKTVDDVVNRREDHHDDGWSHEAQHPAIREVIG